MDIIDRLGAERRRDEKIAPKHSPVLERYKYKLKREKLN